MSDKRRGAEAVATHTIGEVISLLKDEFPDLTVSKVRFLEGKGLIHPRRSESGYRLFTDDDVNRIRFILREQRDHYLPLKVIKSKLTAWERGEDPPVPVEPAPPPETYFAASGVSLSAEELMRSAGIGPVQLKELKEAGILTPVELENGEEVYVDEDLVVARSAARLMALGLETRHLRSVRLAADREADLLRQLVAPLLRHRNPDTRRRAAESLADGAESVGRMQQAMVRARLRRLLES